MGNGMADFTHRAATTDIACFQTTEELGLYCHYVHGLVAEAILATFAMNRMDNPYDNENQRLFHANSMALFLQKINIIRDYSEDVDEDRLFWPYEIWGPYGFKDLRELKEPQNLERARWVLSAMVHDALRHVPDVLDGLPPRSQLVTDFLAIPLIIGIRTLSLCFMNDQIFKTHVKLRKAQALKVPNPPSSFN